MGKKKILGIIVVLLIAIIFAGLLIWPALNGVSQVGLNNPTILNQASAVANPEKTIEKKINRRTPALVVVGIVTIWGLIYFEQQRRDKKRPLHETDEEKKVREAQEKTAGERRSKQLDKLGKVVGVICLIALLWFGVPKVYHHWPESLSINHSSWVPRRSDLGSAVVLAKSESYSKIFVPCPNCPFNIYNEEGPVEIIDPEGLTHHDVPGKLLDLGSEKKSGGLWLFKSEVPGKLVRVTMTWRPRQSSF